MRKLYTSTVLIVLFAISTSLAGEMVSFKFSFLGEAVDLSYNNDLLFDIRVNAKDKTLKKFYEEMESRQAHLELLKGLEEAKENLQLSDWLYFKLIRKATERIYRNAKTERKQMLYTMATWYLMTKAGYDTRITNAALKATFLLVHAKEKVYGVKRSPIDKKSYYNLTACYHNLDIRTVAFTINKFKPEQGTRPFTFKLEQLPNVKPMLVEKEIQFKIDNTVHTFQLQLDSTSQMVMKHHPGMSMMQYLEVPISKTAAASLLPQLREMIAGKTEKEAVEILISFTRRGFAYKWDWDIYNDDHPLIADQVFFAPYSDHEDRSALFYYLVKELLDLPMVVITHFNNNITVGVELPEVVGKPFEYSSRQYTICDPTTPSNSKRLGEYPTGFDLKYAFVVGEYK